LDDLKGRVNLAFPEFDVLEPKIKSWIDTFYYLHMFGELREDPQTQETISNEEGGGFEIRGLEAT